MARLTKETLMIALHLKYVEAILTTLYTGGKVLHLIFAFFLVIWRIRRRIFLPIKIVKRRRAVLGEAVLIANAIKSDTAHLNFEFIL